MSQYFYVTVPFSKSPTKWHPTTDVGPFSVLTRGCFPSEGEARQWAADNLEGQPYGVATDDDGDG